MMENGMDFQRLTPQIPPFLSGNHLEPPQMDLETPEQPATSPGECSGTASQVSREMETRAPPRVDSCPDMDTRPTSEVLGMEAQLGTAAQESVFHMTAISPEECHSTASKTLPLSPNYPALPKVPGPCDPEDLLDGVVFGAKYLGSTQLQCERHPMASTRMRQAQEAVDRVKAPDGESQPMSEVDVMVSTQRVKVLTADTQEALMDHALQTISYTADIGNIVVIMARRKSPRSQDQSSSQKRPHKMLCHVFQSVDAKLIAQAIGQAFGLAYQNFLHSEGVQPERQENTRVTEQLYNADLAHFTKKENSREVFIQKERGEMLGVAVVESGWGSLLPTVVIANLMHGGPAERCGELSIGDHVTSVNGTSLVGLPFSTCQGLIRDLKGQSEVILNIVRCPPVATAIIQRPDTSYQLGFCVEDGVICSLVRGGIAERGGIRVGHRIIEINGQSVVATAHEKIIQTLLDATGEVHIKTMPSSTYRLLTGQETPVYL
ncbi:amyloid-beta A4 precursor protein-binding family A member 3 isoform X2 [Hyla sarda]|uniref:amyloid-beta A4 precursor protein-binding family A member 3 isoform X2 n=1 Tax=Hyla sarda TaxID=327740 RepID=UPI0024C29C51|nr:amyloid-beta A4 precursor protein-binding family A member 3 isoform X2 [Hyla sarda]